MNVKRRRVDVNESPEYERLKPGDEVWFDGYGNGVVQSVGQFRMWIKWEKTGVMDHDVSFARNLEPAR